MQALNLHTAKGELITDSLGKLRSYFSIALISAIIIALVSGTFGLVNSVNAQSDDREVVEVTEDRDGNLYEAGDEVTISGDVSGDVMVAGTDVEVSSVVGDNLFLAGTELVVTGDVVDDIFAAGANILIDGNVEGDIYAAGANVIINGNVEGDVRAAGSEIYINSDFILGDLLLAGESVELVEGLEVGGDLEIDAESEDLEASGTVVALDDLPNRDIYKFDGGEADLAEAFTALSVVFNVLRTIIGFFFWIGSLILAIILVKMFPEFTKRTTDTMLETKGRSLGFGALTLVGVGFIGTLVALTFFGLPIAAFIFLFSFVGTTFANVFARLVLGEKLLATFMKNEISQLLSLFVGYVVVGLVLYLIGLIPIIGGFIAGLIGFLIVSWGVGAMVVNYQADRKLRTAS